MELTFERGTYQVENLEGFKQDVWLCNVVHFLYGEHPEIFSRANIGGDSE